MRKILLFPLLAIWLSGCTTVQPDAFSTDPLGTETAQASQAPPTPSRAPVIGPPFTAPGTNTITLGIDNTGVQTGPRSTPLTVEISRNRLLKWDAPPGFVGLVGTYQIAFTTPAATAASLGVVPAPIGALGVFNIVGTELQTKFANFVPFKTAAGDEYRVWIRAINHLGIRSDWSDGLPVTWPLSPITATGGPSLPPASPVNQRAVLIP